MKPDLRTPPTSAPASRFTALLAALATAIVAGLVCVRLSAYGIWDPWELAVADAARKLGESGQSIVPARALISKVIGAAFSAFATREWAGRLPMAFCGVALLAVTFAWARRLGNTRAGVMSLLVLGTTPLFLLQSRLMIGGTPTFLAGTCVMLGASIACLAPADGREDTRWVWLAFAALSAIASLFLGGAMLTIAPALLAVAITWLLLHANRHDLPAAQRICGLLCVLAAAVITYLVARDVLQHAASSSLWIGGTPLDNAPPTFERVIEHLFHGFAPWSAILPIALGSLLRIEDVKSPRSALKLSIVLWASFAYAAQTLFLSSYGAAPFPAPVALAVAAGLWLDEADRSQRAYWPESLITLLLVGLLIRDFAFYPASPLGSLELDDLKLPDTFNPKRIWAALLGAFALAVVLFGIATPQRDRLNLKAPYRLLVKAWRTSLAHKLWLVALALTLLGLLAFGGGALLAPKALKLTSIARRVGLVLGAVPLVTPLLIAVVQIVYHLSARLARARTVPLFASALLLGGYTSQIFLPQVSEQFSPRGVFDAYNELAKPGEPLAQHRVEGRAAAYYAQTTVKEIAGRTELIEFLSGAGRRWAAFPSGDLADIDVEFRKRNGRHLFVASDATARVTLAASTPVAGATDHNPLTRFVLKTAPKLQHPVNASFEDRVQLLGYDLSMPGKDHVGAGQTFVVTWYWRALKANIGSYKVFVHVDGQDQRLNGDHEPVDGGYPVRLWDVGDVIVDRQELSVPATYPSGIYTLYVGMYRADSRLKIVQGPKDEANRLRAGTIRIR